MCLRGSSIVDLVHKASALALRGRRRRRLVVRVRVGVSRLSRWRWRRRNDLVRGDGEDIEVMLGELQGVRRVYSVLVVERGS